MKDYRITMIVGDALRGELEGHFQAESKEEAEQMAYESYKNCCRDVETVEVYDVKSLSFVEVYDDE